MKLLKPRITEKSVFTRMCIAEAILCLLKDTDFDHLKVSSIVKKAGVSRMTFYKYYATPYEALTDYLKIMIDEYMKENRSALQESSYFEYSHILFSLNFFDRYANYFLTLSRNNLHSILLNGINEFMTERIHTRHPINVYKLISYSGGLLNTFLKWEESGKEYPVEEIARCICDFYHFDRK